MRSDGDRHGGCVTNSCILILVIVEKLQVVGTLGNQDKEESQITFALLIFPSEFPLAFSLLLLQKEALTKVSRDIEVIKRRGALHSPG